MSFTKSDHNSIISSHLFIHEHESYNYMRSLSTILHKPLYIESVNQYTTFLSSEMSGKNIILILHMYAQ